MKAYVATKPVVTQRQKKTSPTVCMHVRGPARTDGRVLREAAALVQRGFAVTIVDIEQDSTMPVEEMLDGITLRHTFPFTIPFLPRLNLWNFIKVLHSHLNCTIQLICKNADAYHAHDWMALPDCYIASRWNRNPLIFDAHELPLSELHGSRWSTSLFSRLLAWIVPRCSGVITVSPPIAQEIRHRYAATHVTLVRNMHGYTPVPRGNRLRESLGLKPEVRIALYQGNLQPDRGLDKVVQAVSLLDSNIVIVLMGKAYGDTRAQLEALIEQEHVADRVKIVPPVPYADLLNWTTSADIGLILYTPEQSLNVQWCLPNKLFEYIMAGLPILATQLDAVAELLAQYHIGRVVPSLAPDSIGEAINCMLADTEELSAMRHNALEAAQNELCWETEQQQLIGLYEKILHP